MDKISTMKLVFKDKDRKPLYKIAKELMHSALLEKEIPYHYFRGLLYKKGSDDYRGFIGNRKIDGFSQEYFNKKNTNLRNKLIFGELIELNGIKTTKTLAYNEGSTIYLNNVPISIKDFSQLVGLLNDLISRTPHQSVFVKPIDGIGGYHAFKFDGYQNLDSNKLSTLFGLLKDNKFIFQETIIQHKKINEIYDNSINTLRIHTYFDKDNNQVEVISGLMRFGFGGSIVDNGSSGGFFITIDIESWTLKGFGRTYLENGGRIFDYHPDSNIKLDKFDIPYGEEIPELVIKAANLFETQLIGWDVAITEDGPLLIEGNEDPHLIMAQIACGGIRKNKGFRKVLSDYI